MKHTAASIRLSSPTQKTLSQQTEVMTWLQHRRYAQVQWYEAHKSGTTMQWDATLR